MFLLPSCWLLDYLIYLNEYQHDQFQGIFLCAYKYSFAAQDSIGRIVCVSLKRANEILGNTTEELVMRAQQSPAAS